MKKFDKDVSVVFPAYNEEGNIEASVLIAYSALTELVRKFEIIVVNDGSTDRTAELCLELAKRFDQVKVVSKIINEGYGYALRDGFKAARYGLIFFCDPDRQFDIFNIKDLLSYIDRYDIVIGFRKVRCDPLRRKVFSFCYNLLMRVIFKLKIRDINCAFKMFRKNVTDSITIESKHYFVNTEILVKARSLEFSVKEVGVSHFPRFEGKTKTRLSDMVRTVKEAGRFYRVSKPHYSGKKRDAQ